jgi:hypothetical protein
LLINDSDDGSYSRGGIRGAEDEFGDAVYVGEVVCAVGGEVGEAALLLGVLVPVIKIMLATSLSKVRVRVIRAY